jgi:hypothetical protein
MADWSKAEMLTHSLGLLLCTSAQASWYNRRRVLEDDNMKYGGIVVDSNLGVTGSEKICPITHPRGA